MISKYFFPAMVVSVLACSSAHALGGFGPGSVQGHTGAAPADETDMLRVSTTCAGGTAPSGGCKTGASSCYLDEGDGTCTNYFCSSGTWKSEAGFIHRKTECKS